MSAGSVVAYRFADFVLDLERGCLQRAGVEVVLRPKAFDVLRYLIEHAEKLVSKSELVEVIWPNVTVSEDSLSQCVLEIRRSLSDTDQRFIRTVPRRGYRFVGEISVVVSEPTAASQSRSAALHREKNTLRPKSLPPAAKVFALACCGALLVAFGAWGGTFFFPGTNAPAIGPVLLRTETAIGQTIASYPGGTPSMRAVVVPLPPGSESGWHSHPVPLFAYVLDGEVSVDYGSRGIRVFKKGEATLEAIDWPHNARNLGTKAARILVLHLGVEGIGTTAAATEK